MQPTSKQLEANIDPQTRDYIKAVTTELHQKYQAQVLTLKNKIDHLEDQLHGHAGNLTARLNKLENKEPIGRKR